MNYKRQLLTGSIYTSISFFVIHLFTIIQSIIVARTLGPESLGIYSIWANLGIVVVPLFAGAIPIAMTKFIAEYDSKDKSKLDIILSTGLVAILLLSIIGSIFYFSLSDFISKKIYNEPALGLLINISATYMTFSVILNYGISTLQGFQEIKLLSKLNVINTIATTFIVSLFVIKMNLIGVVIGSGISIIIQCIVVLHMLFIILRQKQIKLRFNINKTLMKKMFIFSLPLLISGLIVRPAYLFGNSYLFVSQGSGDVGLFRIAFSLYNIVLFIPSIISVPLLPIMSELHANDTNHRSTINSKILRFSLFFALFISIVMGLFSGYIIQLLYGLRYIEAQTVTFIMMITAFFSTIVALSANIFTGTSRTAQGLGFDILLVVTFSLASYYFINLFGLNGFGLAYLITSAIQFPLVIIYLTKKSELKPSNLKEPLLLASVFIPLSFVIFVYMNGIIYLALSLFIVIILLYLEYLLSKKDKILITDMLKLISKICS